MLNLRQMAKICHTKNYKVDHVLFYQGDPGTEMYILLSGTVGVYLNNIDGSMVRITELGKGNFFGEMSLLEEAPRSATIQALEDCIVLVINQENFETIISQQPQFAFRLLKIMSSRIRNLNNQLMDLETQKSEVIKREKVSVPMIVFSQEVPKQKQDLFQKKEKYMQLMAPEIHKKFLFDKDLPCPCCKERFKVKMMKSTSLPLERFDVDLREHYKDFEPLWYQIWICSHCGYANFYTTFLQVSSKTRDFIKERSSSLKKDFTSGFSEPRNFYEVLDAYFQLLYILEQGKAYSIDLAKTWLRISWLYQDVAHQKNRLFAMKQALQYYQDAYFNSNLFVSPKQDARLNLLMGELLFQLQERKDAFRILQNVVFNKEAESLIKQYAEDRIYELKKDESGDASLS